MRRERRSSVGDESQYLFRHLLVRDVAYSQIPRAARAEKHRVAADWIESLGRPDDHAEMLAHHYLTALELDKAAGVDTQDLADRARLRLLRGGRPGLRPQRLYCCLALLLPLPSTSGPRTTRSALSFSCAWDESRFEQRAVVQ